MCTTQRAQTEAGRAKAQAQLRQATGRVRMSRDEIASLIAGLGNYLDVLRQADPQDKAELYTQLNLRLAYRPQEQTVRAEAHPQPALIGEWLVSEERAEPISDACRDRRPRRRVGGDRASQACFMITSGCRGLSQQDRRWVGSAECGPLGARPAGPSASRRYGPAAGAWKGMQPQ